MAWPHDDIEKLKKLWGEGIGATDIAKRLGGRYSRNGVVGKAHRLGLERRLDPVARMHLRFKRVCDRVIDAEIGQPISLERAARLEGMSPITAQKMWDETIEFTHGGDPE